MRAVEAAEEVARARNSIRHSGLLRSTSRLRAIERAHLRRGHSAEDALPARAQRKDEQRTAHSWSAAKVDQSAEYSSERD